MQKLPSRPKAKTNERLGLLLCWGLVPSPVRENRKAGRREGLQGSENAFLFLGDQNQKYFPWKRAEDSRLAACGGRLGAKRANPQCLASRLPAFLLFPARSREVARFRYGSFCDSGCSLAAQVSGRARFVHLA